MEAMRKTSAPTTQRGPGRPQVPSPPKTRRPLPGLARPKLAAPTAAREADPQPPAPECIFEASEIGLLLEPEDDVLAPSAVGMVLEPSRGEPTQPTDLVPDPPPKPRRTPRRNPYCAPESQWDARLEAIDRPKPRPRPRVAIWTAVSAGASALACCMAFLVAAPAETAPAQAAASEPIVIRYDEDLLDPPTTETAPAAIATDDVGDRRSHALALALRGRTNMLAGRTKLALAQFHEALEYNAKNRLALAQLGEWHLEHGRAAKASEYLRRAVRVEPRDGKAHHLLARAYERLGRPQKAQFHDAAAAKHGYGE